MKKLITALLLLIGSITIQAQTLFSENFESSWTTASTLTGWTATGSGNSEWHRNDYTTGWTSPTNGIYPNPLAAENTLYSARFHSYDATNGSKGTLITPSITLTGSGTKKLEFYTVNTNGSDRLKIYMSTDDGVTWGTELLTCANSQWTKQTVTLNTASPAIKLKFEANAASYNGGDIGLDQITVKNISETDPPVISSPSPDPLQAPTGTNMFVTVTVTDASGIDNVKMTYKKGSWGTNFTGDLTPIGNNQYRGAILWNATASTTDTEPLTGMVKFTATDNLGNAVTSTETAYQWVDMEEIYSEGFEAFYTDITASPWKIFSTDGDAQNFNIGRPGSGADAATGNYCLMSKSSTQNTNFQTVPLNTDNYVVLPQISMPVDNGQHIYLAYSTAGTATPTVPELGEEHYQVKIGSAVSNPPQASDFTTTIADETTVSGYKKHFINMNAFKGQMIYLAFEHQQYNKNVFRLDDIEIRKVTDNTAPAVSETAGLSDYISQPLVPVIKVADNTAIKSVKAYYTIGSGNEVVQNMSVYTDALYSQQEAYYYITIPAQNTPVSGTIKFETEDIFGNKFTTENSTIEWLQVLSSLNEDFENWSGTSKYWTIKDNDLDYNQWSLNTTTVHSGLNSIAIKDNITDTNEDYLTYSPVAINNDTKFLTFYAKSNNQENLPNLKIQAQVIGQAAADLQQITAIPLDSWTKYDYDLSAYLGQNIKISFICNTPTTQNGPDNCYLYLDDIKLSSTSAINNAVVPEQTRLEQNYPNPFNPTTQICFNLANESQVKLAVYNAKGEEVALLVNNTSKPGRYAVDFCAENLNSGVYFYKLTTGSNVISRKMLLLK